MKERPIVCYEHEVKAILEGRQTQIRRLIKPQPPKWITNAGFDFFSGENEIAFRGNHPELGPAEIFMPVKARIGDHLWVKESWHQHYGGGRIGGRPCYKADESCLQAANYGWHSSISMPRLWSRIILEITCLWIQRVQEIKHFDALAEGIDLKAPMNNYGTGSIYVDTFAALWDSIRTKRDYSWSNNPWVLVREFKVLEVGK